jgi:hypothetical protein
MLGTLLGVMDGCIVGALLDDGALDATLLGNNEGSKLGVALWLGDIDGCSVALRLGTWLGLILIEGCRLHVGGTVG